MVFTQRFTVAQFFRYVVYVHRQFFILLVLQVIIMLGPVFFPVLNYLTYKVNRGVVLVTVTWLVFAVNNYIYQFCTAGLQFNLKVLRCARHYINGLCFIPYK